VGELAGLTVDNFNLGEKTLTFYRQKVNKYQTMALKNGLLAAARAYFDNGDAPAIGSLWRSSRKSKTGRLQETGGWSVRAINARITDLGAAVGIDGLSPHDLRHYWATQAARNNTPMDRLQDAGGWSSLAMPARYIESAKIANEGVNLGEE
jgi:integrase